MILDLFPNTAQIRCNEGRIPLHLAAFNGNEEIIKLLLNIYPDGARSQTTEICYTPLFIAADYGRTGTYVTFISHGFFSINFS